MTKDEPIVTYRTYYDPMLAHIEQSRLEDSGIHCFIQDENIATINPFYNTAVGGIKLKVFERDIEQCNAILGIDESVVVEDLPEVSEEGEQETVCPNCGSTNVRFGDATQKKYDWLAIILAVIFIVMPFYARKRWHCFNCGKDFKAPAVTQ